MSILRQLAERIVRRLAREIAAAAPPQNAVQSPPETRLREPNRRSHRSIAEIESSLDWEPLAHGIADAAVYQFAAHSANVGSLSIARDDDYSLKISLETSLGRESLHEHIDGVPGTIAEGFLVEASGPFPSDVVRLPNALVGNFSSTWFAHKPVRTTVDLVASRVELAHGDETEPPSFITEWFISGPRQFSWPRATTRERHERFVRSRTPRGDVAEPGMSIGRPPAAAEPSQGWSWDHLRAEVLDGVCIIVAEVPRDHGPSWSKCIGVEYHASAGRDVAQDERDAVGECLGFLFGRQMLRVGRTSYDTMGQPIAGYACSPWGRDAVATSLAPDMRPFDVVRGGVERHFATIMKSYLVKRSELSLQQAMWTIWIAGRMPSGFELPLYASALETLMHAWFRSTRTKSKGVYMAKAAFDAATGETFQQMEARLAEQVHGDRMVRRMRNAYQMGVNERFEGFFEEIGLAYGAGELAVIKGRNAVAHGGTGASDLRRRVVLARGYQTLLNRVLLKLLGGSDTYTDYSCIGFPERALDTAIGFDPSSAA